MDDTTVIETEAPGEIELMRHELEESRGRERETIARLKAALIATEPTLEESLITGETLEEVESSFASARALVARIRERAVSESGMRIPAGAPGRIQPQPRTAFEKIREGLGRGA